MFEVVYFSCMGNTRKVADVIAATLGVTPKYAGAAGVIPPDAFIFLGTGVYRGTLPEEVIKFLKVNCFPGRKVALFTTSIFDTGEERREIEKQLESYGAVIVRNFKCLGRFVDINKGHPNWLELKKAAWFARSVALTLYERHEEKAEALSPVG